MKLAITSLIFAVAVAAQGDFTPQPAAVESAPGPMATAMPQVSMPTTMPSTTMGGQDTVSLLTRLVSFFDLTRVSASLTTMPVLMASVYDPTSNKFTFLSSSLVQSGDASYVPVCSIDSITSAGSTPVLAQGQSDVCPYGIQLTPMPSNVAARLFKVLRIKVKLFLSLLKPSFWFGRTSFGGMHNTAQMMQNQPMM
ncbi:hypothetical protein IW139_002196 [Coemansia sp. RSA 353]|nr:hypothetical protein GGH17_005846 [Coemansia sp. RSA 788]KAJ2180822.1 hypothetical protein GGF45_001812 [Coemansia sp. RSA 551]KAJ2224559.1 hypothetical protein IW143_000496 [Coemansia sp. RSA 520]KAJ2269451.1 hypothetical protein GGH14_005466 [Coemansia sp. RSA 370]KAJ2298608.1 hypothetical protein IW139_002196 [Coemansia sp. RSA 353]KAJ2532058.1 hypothetical protein IWW43_003400 [Coemansia sp. RSA 1935]KAJ2587187.1 hypothetical protein IWW49_003607 [Coemansia sp. RSA 1797]